MHKPPRRMHTSTGRFPLSRRSPSKHRAFLGVFNITKSIGRHDKCQRPRISLQIKRCRPITPPIIRESIDEHGFLPERRYAGAFDCRILAKMHVATTPTWHEAKQKRGQKAARHLFIRFIIARTAISRQRRPEGNLPFRRTPQDARSSRRTKCAARASCMSEDAPERKVALGPDR